MTAASNTAAAPQQSNILSIFTKLQGEAKEKLDTAAGISTVESRINLMVSIGDFWPFQDMLEVISDRLSVMKKNLEGNVKAKEEQELDRIGIVNLISLIILRIQNLSDDNQRISLLSTTEYVDNVVGAGTEELKNLLTAGSIGFSNPDLYRYINALCSLVAKNKPKTLLNGLRICHRAGIDLTPTLYEVCSRDDLTPLQLETLIKLLVQFDANPNGTFLVRSDYLALKLLRNSTRVTKYAITLLVSAGLTVHMKEVNFFTSLAGTSTASQVNTWLSEASIFRASIMEELFDRVLAIMPVASASSFSSINEMLAYNFLRKGLIILTYFFDSKLPEELLCIITSYFAMPVRLADKICLEAAIKDHESKAIIVQDSKMSDE